MIRDAARHFAIWRAAEAADWTITPEEIAAITHLDVRTVRHVLASRGWQHRLAARYAAVATDALPLGSAPR